MPRQTCGEILRRGVYPEPFDDAQDRLRGIQDVGWGFPGFHPGYDFGNEGAAIAQAFPEQLLIQDSLLGSRRWAVPTLHLSGEAKFVKDLL